MSAIVIAILEVAIPVLAQFIVAFITNLGTENLTQALADAALEIVKSVDGSASLANAEKQATAADALRNFAVDKGLTVKDSAVNVLVELAVQRLKAETK